MASEHAVAEPAPEPRITETLLRIVVHLLQTEGYDAVQLRRVAQIAKVSLSTIYRRFPTRDDLILCALQRWLEKNRYAGLRATLQDRGVAGAAGDEPGSVAAQLALYRGLMQMYTALFQPWEQHPQMLRAFLRARAAPGGERLLLQGMDAVQPFAEALMADADPGWISDCDLIITNVTYALMARFASDEIAICDILPALDRVVHRITLGGGSPLGT
jgi:TetR/AcrR family transcriptional regulator, cholesterol catabolism regulator